MRLYDQDKQDLRRIKKFNLRGGFHVEISWHYGARKIVAEVTAPDGKWSQCFADSRREIINKIRYDVEFLRNGEFRKVVDRLRPSSFIIEHTPSFKKNSPATIIQMMQALHIPMSRSKK